MSKALFALLAIMAIMALAFAEGGTGSSSSSSDMSMTSSGGGGGENSHPEDSDRNIQVSGDKNGMQLESDSRSTSVRQKSAISYQIEDTRLSIRLQTFTKSTTKQDFQFKIKIGGLVEYVENGAHAGFQRGEDAVGTTWQFSKDAFAFSTLPDTTVAGATVKNFQGQSMDKVFTVVGHMSSTTFSAGGQVVTPGKQKFDIIIDTTNFTYTKTGSRLAIIAAVQSASSVRTTVKDDSGSTVTSESHRSRSVQFGADATPTAFFDWAANVTVTPGNTQAAVITSAMAVDTSDSEGESDGENNKAVSFAFDVVQPVKIEWDPSVGVGAGAFNGAAAVAPVVSLIAALAVAAALFSRQQ
jgi:hypothetical protein